MNDKVDKLSILNDKSTTNSKNVSVKDVSTAERAEKKSSTRGSRSKMASQVESEDISLSQLEVMANKKKLSKKSDEISISQLNVVQDKASTIEPVRKKKTSSAGVSSSQSSTESSRVDKRKQRMVARENKSDSVRKEKCEYLYKLEKITSKSKWRSAKMDMNNSLDEIRNEYERVSNEMKTERSVAFFKRMLLLGVQGIEMVNNRFDPLGVDLDGWSEAMGYSLENQEYDEVLADLYEKYKGSGQMSPEMKLVFMIISSATMFTISKKITKLDSSNMFANFIGNLTGQQQSSVPQQQSNMQQHDIVQNYTETTEDVRPSKLNGPSAPIVNVDGIDINNILKTMNERKQEKTRELAKAAESRTETSDEVFKSIPMNNPNRKRGRPRKNNVSKGL